MCGPPNRVLSFDAICVAAWKNGHRFRKKQEPFANILFIETNVLFGEQSL